MPTAPAVTDELIAAAQAGDPDAMWRLVEAHDPMLKNIVRAVAPAADLDRSEDLLQEARVAFIEHVRDYSTSTASAKLHTFAYRAVKRSVAEEWVRATTALSVDPTTVLRVKHALWRTGGDVEEAWAIVSTEGPAKRRLSREVFVSVCEALAEALNLDAPSGGRPAGGQDSTQTLADTIPDASSDFTDATERRDLARHLLGEINPRQSYALRAFHGIGMTRMPDEQVSDELGVKTGRKCEALRQIRQRGLNSCRSVATAQGLSIAA